jgi:hypothetical protein
MTEACSGGYRKAAVVSALSLVIIVARRSRRYLHAALRE